MINELSQNKTKDDVSVGLSVSYHTGLVSTASGGERLLKWTAAKGELKRRWRMTGDFFLYVLYVFCFVLTSPTVTQLSFPAIQFKIAKPHPLVSVLLPFIYQVIILIVVDDSYPKVKYIAVTEIHKYVTERVNQTQRCIFSRKKMKIKKFIL